MNVSYGLRQKTSGSANSKSLKTKYQAKRVEIDETLFGKCGCKSGAKPNKSGRNDEELKKVTSMVKAGNYNHPELVVLPESEVLRMKVCSV